MYLDVDVARSHGYADAVFPPLYPVHAMRRARRSDDPFTRLADDADWDGISLSDNLGGLPTPELPTTRILNGGVDAEFFALAVVGDTISSQSRYEDIYEREGRSGRMIFIVVVTEYRNQNAALLLRVRGTIIGR